MDQINDTVISKLIQIQAHVLFTYDNLGRILQANEPWPNPGQAPRFFLGIPTKGVPIRRYRNDVPEALLQALEAAAIAEPVPNIDDEYMPRYTAVYKQLLQSHEWEAGPSFLVPETLALNRSTIHLTKEHISLIGPDFKWLPHELEYVQPCAAVIEDGRVVSVCRSVRINHMAHEAGVDTLPPFRGRGYATAVLAHWAAMVRAIGALPLYSTSWENHNSRRVARKANLICYGSSLSIL